MDINKFVKILPIFIFCATMIHVKRKEGFKMAISERALKTLTEMQQNEVDEHEIYKNIAVFFITCLFNISVMNSINWYKCT